jgi:DNA-binding response OmpR family regulator
MWYKDVSDIRSIFRFGDNEVNFENFTARNKNGSFQLTMHEAMLLKYLVENKNKIVSRKELLEHVWNISSDIDTRTVDNFISRLRKYFEPNPAKPIYFKSVRSAGYMFCD